MLITAPTRPRQFRDTAAVAINSLGVTSFTFALPFLLYIIFKKIKSKRRRAVALSLLAVAIFVGLPKKSRFKLKRDEILKWQIWERFLHYLQVSVVDDSCSTFNQMKNEQKIIAMVPHGILPWGIALPSVSGRLQSAFAPFRPIIATATSYIPILGSILEAVGAVDATRANVDAVLTNTTDSVAVCPGGIAEMFATTPNKQQEFALLNDRKGFVRMAIRHRLPIVPVYIFGSSRLMRRLPIPGLELLSKLLKISLIAMYGRMGLPVPFPVRLLYVIGRPLLASARRNVDSESTLDELTDEIHGEYCSEISRIFEEHKHSYEDWGDKKLTLI